MTKPTVDNCGCGANSVQFVLNGVVIDLPLHQKVGRRRQGNPLPWRAYQGRLGTLFPLKSSLDWYYMSTEGSTKSQQHPQDEHQWRHVEWMVLRTG